MLISPDNPKTAGLCGIVKVIDSITGDVVDRVYSFDTQTKWAELMIKNEKGEARVLNGKVALERVHCPNYKVFNSVTKKEIL